MTWVMWRQHRASLAAGALIALAVALFLVITGADMHATFINTGLAHCLAVDRNACGDLANSFTDHYSAYQFVIPLFLLLPALAGLFWGAPLVAREVEHGTHRLAWTQSITSRRWLVSKLVALIAACIVFGTALTLMLQWWSDPLVSASGARFNLGIFDLLGPAPVAYMIFAFSVGVAAGTIVGRTVAAMGATLLTFIGVRAAVALLVRPHLLPAETTSYAFAKGGTPTQLQDAWILSSQTLDSSGRLVGEGRGINFDLIRADCPNLPGPGTAATPDVTAIQACIQHAGVHVVATYEPASRYLLFQGLESALFILFAAGLLAATAWWVRHRVS